MPLTPIHLGTISHADALALQQARVDALLAGTAGPALFLLEHEPVYTIGRTRDQSSLGGNPRLPHPVVEINRGGQATYHGPGQLVAYPILDLGRHGRDLHAYLRTLEEAVIRTLADFGITSGRRDGMTGVWAGPRKIASLGVGVKKWITMHGLALNVTPECLPPFQFITPCGLDGVSMTCLHHESPGPTPTVRETADHLVSHLNSLLLTA